MNFLHMLGLGSKKLMASGSSVLGQVTEVQTCRWLRVNTQPVRTGPADTALYPHLISYRFTVDGREYQGKRLFGPYSRYPREHEAIRVYFDPRKPERATVRV